MSHEGNDTKAERDFEIAQEDRDTEVRCVICKKTRHGFGHNAEPVAPGRCCDACNTVIVIPSRLFESRRGN